MALNRLQIVDLAIAQAQLDSSYRAQARMWLNVIIDKQSSDFRWPFYNKQAAFTQFVVGSSSYLVPQDYSKSDSIYLYNVDGQRGAEVPIVEPYIFDQSVPGNLTGRPNFAMIDVTNQRIIFNATPGAADSQMGYKLRYFRMPNVLSLDVIDDTAIPDFADQNFLIQELIKWAFENLDDERYSQKAGEAQKNLQDTKRMVYENDGTSNFPLEMNTFRMRRRRW